MITGASDDDPSGVATYSQAGAAQGYGMLWVSLVTSPLTTAVQEICDRTALATGKSLGELVKVRWRSRPAHLLVGSLLVGLLGANVLNIVADLVAVGSGMSLLHAGPTWMWALMAGVGPPHRCGRISSVRHCGEPVERRLKLVADVRSRTSKALLVGQLGPVAGVGDMGSRHVDRFEFPPPEMSGRLLTRLAGSPRNAPALIELGHMILSNHAITCERHGEHLTDVPDSLPAAASARLPFPSQRG